MAVESWRAHVKLSVIARGETTASSFRLWSSETYVWRPGVQYWPLELWGDFMITRVEEWCENVLDARWFQWLLVGSVIYAAAWLYALPRGAAFDVGMWMAVGLWVTVFAMLLERRWRERTQGGAKVAGVGH
jgi:hypothetical protein